MQMARRRKYQYSGRVSPELRHRIGRRIAELRHARGFSQKELAEAAGIAKDYVPRYESGKIFPASCIEELAVALGVDVVELFQPDELKKPAEVVLVINMIERYAKKDPKALKVAAGILSALSALIDR